MAFCPRCNSELSDNAAFCLSCGTYFGAPVAEVVPPGAPRPPKEAAHESTQLTSSQAGDTPSAQGPAPPDPTVLLPADFRQVLTRGVDRIRQFLAEVASWIRSKPRIALGAALSALIVVVAFAAWHAHRSRTSVATDPRATEVAKLEKLARDAYKRHHYVVPVETSAIAYSKRILALDPSNNYSRKVLDNSVSGAKYQVQQALNRKDFATAQRLADAMSQLLPTRKDIAELRHEVHTTGKGTSTPLRPKPVAHPRAAPRLSFTAYHLHGEKAPAEHGPYCLGTLSMVGQHLRFTGRSASRGQKVHRLDFACSEVREIKKNARIASRQGGFHVRTVSASTNFVPRDSSLTPVSALATACSNREQVAYRSRAQRRGRR